MFLIRIFFIIVSMFQPDPGSIVLEPPQLPPLRIQARPAHRLDALTGGLMVLAKSKSSMRQLSEAFAQERLPWTIFPKVGWLDVRSRKTAMDCSFSPWHIMTSYIFTSFVSHIFFPLRCPTACVGTSQGVAMTQCWHSHVLMTLIAKVLWTVIFTLESNIAHMAMEKPHKSTICRGFSWFMPLEIGDFPWPWLIPRR